MTALLLLQLRAIGRGVPAIARPLLFFGILMGALLFGAKDVTTRVAFNTVGIPMVFFLILAAVTGNAEDMTWLAPVRRSTRIWSRITILTATGTLGAGIVLLVHLVLKVASPERWLLMTAHLWACWVAGGLLLSLVEMLARSLKPFGRTLAMFLAAAPSFVLAEVHLGDPLGREVLVAELAAAVVLAVLNFVANRDLEWIVPEAAPEEQAETPPKPAAAARRTLDRTASVRPVLFTCRFSAVPTWIWLILWLGSSCFPVAPLHFWFGITLLPLMLRTTFAGWRPFQATPFDRRRAFLWLLGPCLALWAFTLVLQCGLILAESPALVQTVGGTEFEVEQQRYCFEKVRLKLPYFHRAATAAMSPHLRGDGSKGAPEIPAAPPEAAALMSEALKAAYGIDVPPAEILALRPPGDLVRGYDLAQADWLRNVEQHGFGRIRWNFLGWRILIGALVLTWAALWMFWLIPGRCPPAILVPLGSATFLAILVLPVITRLKLTPADLPGALHAVYVAAFDHPWIFAGAAIGLSALLLLRHARAFRTSGLAEETAAR